VGPVVEDSSFPGEWTRRSLSDATIPAGDGGVGDFTPVLVAIITSLGTVAAAALTAGWLQRRRPHAAAAKWRDQAELERARAELMTSENAELRAKLADTQRSFDDCARQRDKAWSDLRKRDGSAAAS